MPVEGRKPVGGRREGAGRKKGSPNKITRDVRALAGVYTEEALRKLANIMRRGKSDQACVAAAKELLDRACGKAPQAVYHAGHEGGPLQFDAMSLEELKALATRLEHSLAISEAPGGDANSD